MKDILRSLRNENNYSQSAVASYLNISRQMYNKYENGLAEPSLKNIKKLCELYKVSADIFFKNLKMDEDNSCSYELHSPEELCVAEPDIPYDVFNNQNNTKNLLTELINLIPLLQLNEQISLMSRLASIIEKQTCIALKNPIKPKKLKQVPDAEYNKYLDSDELRQIRKASLASIRELLKDDEW